jgi:hypothetical protein
MIVLDNKTFRHVSVSIFTSNIGDHVNRKIKYTIPTTNNFAKVDFTIKWNIVSLQIDVMTFKINAHKIIWLWNISIEFVAKIYAKTKLNMYRNRVWHSCFIPRIKA